MDECRDGRLEVDERALFSLSAEGSEREFCPASPCGISRDPNAAWTSTARLSQETAREAS